MKIDVGSKVETNFSDAHQIEKWLRQNKQTFG